MMMTWDQKRSAFALATIDTGAACAPLATKIILGRITFHDLDSNGASRISALGNRDGICRIEA
jgi:hypothetical protein